MTEEEYFRKTYPDSCYGDRPLSPHWDFFQDGVEFGERESEEKITELELQLEREKNLNQCLSDNNEQLREQIERMKCCYNCKHSRTEYEHCRTEKSEKWEIKEK
jgi:hypothetical protein